jgi:hypothetical protein
MRPCTLTPFYASVVPRQVFKALNVITIFVAVLVGIGEVISIAFIKSLTGQLTDCMIVS